MDSDKLYCHRLVAQPHGRGILCHGLTRTEYEAGVHPEGFHGPPIASNYPQRGDVDGRPVSLYAIRNAFSVPPNPVADEFAFRTSPSSADAISPHGAVPRPLLKLDGESLAAEHRGIMGMVWSPDGRWLVYASGIGGVNDAQPLLSSVIFSAQPYGKIWAYRIADGFHVRLTSDKWEDGAPFWAPGINQSMSHSK